MSYSYQNGWAVKEMIEMRRFIKLLKQSLLTIPVAELVKSYIIAIILFIMMANSSNFFYGDLFTCAYFILCLLLFPLSVALYRTCIHFIFGERYFFLNTIIALIIWLVKTFILYWLAVPLGLIYILGIFIYSVLQSRFHSHSNKW